MTSEPIPATSPAEKRYGDPAFRTFSAEELIAEVDREIEDADATDLEATANVFRAVRDRLNEVRPVGGESLPGTLRHIARVREILDAFAAELIRRATVHDASKFDPVEQGPLDEVQRLNDLEGPAEYGSAEYARRVRILGPMLEHHYSQNSHHPEHYREDVHGVVGVAGMDLFDLVEMFCDWRAANLDRDGGAPMNLSLSIDKYQIDWQLASILRHTATRQGWAVK